MIRDTSVVSFLSQLETPTIAIIDEGTSPSLLVINEFDNVTLRCQAQGAPVPQITWFRLLNNQTDRDLPVENSTLINVTRTESGYYECQAWNGELRRRQIELRVLCK